MRSLRRLWNDEAGFIISSELILVATILVIGLIAGLTTIRDQVVTELADVAGAISDLDQSYSFGNITAHCASTNGSNFVDLVDFCDTAGSQGGDNTNFGAQSCVIVCTGLVEEG